MRWERVALIFSCILFQVLPGILRVENVMAQDFHFINYNVEDGLLQSEVMDIVQDRRGYLWIGTSTGGVNRFDGTQFVEFNQDNGLLTNEITAIHEDKSGNIWFLHRGEGVSKYDGIRFTTFPTNDEFQLGQGGEFCEDAEGKLWVAGWIHGAYRFDGTQWEGFHREDGLPSDTVLTVYADAAGTVWFGTGRGVVTFRDGRFAPPPWPTDLSENFVWAFGTDAKGRMLISTTRRLLRVEDGAPTPLQAVSGIGRIDYILKDNQDRMWLCGTRGVGRLQGDEFFRFREQEGLMAELGFNVAIQDLNGNIWLGSLGGGLSKYTGDAFMHFGDGTPIEGKAVFAVAEMKPMEYLVGTERGMYHFRNKQFSRVKGLPESVPDVRALYNVNGKQYYVGTNEGLYFFDGYRFHTIIDDDATFNGVGVAMISKLPDGETWVSTNSGWYLLEGKAVRPAPLPEKYRFTDGQNVFEDSRGDRWFVTGRDGLILQQGDVFHEIKKEDGLPTNVLSNVIEDRNGNIWIASYAGLARYRDDEICYFTAREGLNGNVVYLIEQDAEGNIWAGTERGLTRIAIDDNSDPTTIRTYGKAEGFTGVECNLGASLLDARGHLWFGTIYGLTCYDPSKDLQNEKKVRTRIASVRLHLEEVDWAMRSDSITPWNGLPIRPVLEPNENHLRFDFNAVTMRLPEKVRYQYKMEGLEEQWTPPTSESYAVYPAMPPGSYTFKVKASNSDGMWNDQPTEFSFTIRQPFYKSVWFLLIILAAVGLIIWSVVMIRIRNLQRIRERLARKVKQRTEALERANEVKSEFLAKMSHEIRTPMNGVIGMTDLLRRTPLNEQQHKFLKNIRISGENLLGLINDILDFSRIESGKLDLESVPLDVRSLIEEVLDILAYGAYEKGLELVYWADPDIRGPIVGDPARLKQILVNLVGNAIKFTEKGRIAVRVNLLEKESEKATIRFSVKDSGIGIPEEKFKTLFESFTQVDASTTRKYGGTGLGLAISYNLSKMMGGDMWVESQTGAGAEFFFTIKAGLSAPWKVQLEDHPARALEGKIVMMTVFDPEFRMVLDRYLAHWGVHTRLFDTLEALSDAMLDAKQKPDFLLVDTRQFSEHHERAAETFAATCAQQNVHFALLAEPSLAIKLRPAINDHGWILSKPLKRDDLLNALLLKRVSIHAGEVAQAAEAQLADDIPMRILIAEDNPINMDVAQGMLGNLGYVPLAAENGLEVLELLESETFDLIFMDVQMPEMDGLEATRRIIAKYGAQRPMIVAMTANAMESDRKRCMEAGMDTFISKPFVMDELVAFFHAVAEGTVREGNAETTETPSSVRPAAETPDDAAAPKLTDMGMLEAASQGDTAFIIAILQKLIVKMPEAIAELRTAAAESDWDNVRATAHRTKSSAAYTGAESLKEQFRELEHIAGERENLEQVPEKIQALDDYVTAVVRELETTLEQLKANV